MLPDEVRAEIESARARYDRPASALMPAFWAVQHQAGWVSADAAREIAEMLGLHPGYVSGVLSFYGMYHRQPPGRYVLHVCHTLSCALAGAEGLLSHLEQRLGVAVGETTPDGMFTLLTAECLASCGTGPAMLVNEELHESVSPDVVDDLLARLSRAEADAGTVRA